MKKRVLQFALGAALALSGAGAVLAFTVDAPTGFVNDRAAMLTPGYVAELESQLSEYEKATGNEIAVLTVKNLQGEDIEGAAVDVFEQWGIGKAEEDNGLLLMISKEEQKIKIEVGYGLEPYITDGRAGRIIRDDMAPAFKEKKYDDGMREAIASIQGYLEGAPASPDEESGGGFPDGLINFIFFFVFVAFRLIVGLLATTRGWWLGGVLGVLFGGGVGFFIDYYAIPVLGALFGFLGLLLDFIVSKYADSRKAQGLSDVWWWHGPGGSGGSSGGGGFGGFGGGSSGGGGASGGW